MLFNRSLLGMTANLISLNSSKTEVLFIGNSESKNNLPKFQVLGLLGQFSSTVDNSSNSNGLWTFTFLYFNGKNAYRTDSKYYHQQKQALISRWEIANVNLLRRYRTRNSKYQKRFPPDSNLRSCCRLITEHDHCPCDKMRSYTLIIIPNVQIVDSCCSSFCD